MRQFLLLRLEGPLAAFGGEAIDNFGVIRAFPAKSMITGLLANALGIERTEARRLQALQDELVIGSRIDAPGQKVRDFQTAQLSKGDQGWTSRRLVEGRAGGSSSYSAPHLRYRDYWTEVTAHVALHLLAGATASLDEIESALLEPARPLFLGRKSCLPSAQILQGRIDAPSVLRALLNLRSEQERSFRLQWPASDQGKGDEQALSSYCIPPAEPICDERNWITGVHGGLRLVRVLEVDRQEGHLQ